MAGLAITCKEGESVWIGEAKVTVQRKKSGGLLLVIEAPKDVRVLRDQIKKDQAAAAKSCTIKT